MPTVLPHVEISLPRPHWLAEEAALIGPVSSPNSLLAAVIPSTSWKHQRRLSSLWMTGLLRQFEPNRSAGLPLAHRGPSEGISVRCNVFDFQGYDIAAAQFTVDRQVEHRQVPGSALDLEVSCRKCTGTTYQSTMGHIWDRPARRVEKLRARLQWGRMTLSQP